MSDIVKVIIAKAKLKGDETENEISASLSAHLGLRENGFIRNVITCDTNGKPEYIVSIWKASDREANEKICLQKGQRFAFLLKSEIDLSCKS